MVADANLNNKSGTAKPYRSLYIIIRCKHVRKSCHECNQQNKHYDEHGCRKASRLRQRQSVRRRAATGIHAVTVAKCLPCNLLRRHSLTQFVKHFTPRISEAERMVKAARAAISEMKSHCPHLFFTPHGLFRQRLQRRFATVHSLELRAALLSPPVEDVVLVERAHIVEPRELLQTVLVGRYLRDGRDGA